MAALVNFENFKPELPRMSRRFWVLVIAALLAILAIDRASNHYREMRRIELNSAQNRAR